MAERPPTPEDPDRRTPGRWPPNWVDPLPARTPRWVKVFGAVAALVVLLVAVMLLTGHGPGRHMRHGLGDFHASSGAGPQAPR